MKKIFIIGMLGLAGISAHAQNYSFVSLSYDNTQAMYGDSWGDKDGLEIIGVDGNSASLNGFGIQYTYGIGLCGKPMNIELGLKWNMGFLNKTQEDSEEYGNYFYSWKDTAKTQLMRLSIPVSYIYHFHINDMFAIAPYAGLDFRFNLSGKTKFEYSEYDSYYDEWDSDEETYNWFKKYKDGNDGVDEDYVWKRFQMGWHVGLRFEIKKLFLGVEYGTDFMPLWSYKWDDGDKAHVNTGNLAVNVGFKF